MRQEKRHAILVDNEKYIYIQGIEREKTYSANKYPLCTKK